MKEEDAMKAMRVLLAIMLSLFVFTSAGCLPKWTVDHVQYGLSDVLYADDDVGGTAPYNAADGFTHLIIKVDLAYSGLAAADIKDELIFKIIDPVPPVVDIENFYENSAFTLFDALQEYYPSRGSDTGSIFFLIPDNIDLDRYTFQITDKAYNLINAVSFQYIPLRTYPGQF